MLTELTHKEFTSWEKRTIARLPKRPLALDFIERIFDSFIELHGDRAFGEDASIVGGIAMFDSMAVTVIAQQKGSNTKDKIKRNFGMPNPEGYRKVLRLMKQAEKFKRPVICFIDTPGAFCGIGAEERGQGEAIAINLLKISSLKTPIISIVIGEGGSGGALALGVADEVWMLEHAVYSILSPEGFASILWKDSSRAKEAAGIMKITAQDLLQYKIINRIIKEPAGGAHKDVDKTSESIKNALVNALPILLGKTKKELIEDRYERYRCIGVYEEN
ncbi:acetyl-CoA carboxylase carboxyltransferase subunit alpha [Clostridium bowmanii]|uniref:acetyl-CoA carboxylase carboxyltransferase subunit alpha n=1 Tax=Clostridium bowmanii TaxID=132925 RepID=UPI001C0A9E40|nr:acetyl-CoA carboxylase carboxyltransferase subunit alpha [Clostridium bowmanii]MBU3188255.1 acetyl-CoA carboxylase carboxyltransferase subunit alpha [Clostridium bowmanii]MCA1072641.1 acetyl-CoA carboxylase carboxyltransferase subunit alpha [Clostridium bowmanii]